MMGYIITGMCCFVAGSITGIVCISLCQVSKTYDDTEQIVDYYHDCSDDCERCHNNKESGGVSE